MYCQIGVGLAGKMMCQFIIGYDMSIQPISCIYFTFANPYLTQSRIIMFLNYLSIFIFSKTSLGKLSSHHILTWRDKSNGVVI